uniref:BED-type domain-containing protein n=1 Tax=Amphimedon queenslandica TaxID=400682 RepID=A0A1X7VKS9_AMPQE
MATTESHQAVTFNPVELIAKPNTKAQVWDYFGLKKADNGSTIDNGSAICRVCHKKVIVRQGNTSNLTGHLQAKHPKLYNQMKNALTSQKAANDLANDQTTSSSCS